MDWDIFIAEFKQNKKPLAIVSGGVFLFTFLLVIILRGCGPEDPSISEKKPERRVMKREDGFAKKSFTGILDSKLPINTPHSDFNRSLSGGTIQLVRRGYRLTDRELNTKPVLTNRVPSGSVSNPTHTPPAAGEKKSQPEIDMILKRPVSRPQRRSTY